MKQDGKNFCKEAFSFRRESDLPPIRKTYHTPGATLGKGEDSTVCWAPPDCGQVQSLHLGAGGDPCTILANDSFLTFYTGKAKLVPLPAQANRLTFLFPTGGAHHRPPFGREEKCAVSLEKCTLSFSPDKKKLLLSGIINGMTAPGLYRVGAVLEGCQTDSFSAKETEVPGEGDGRFSLQLSLNKCAAWSPDKPWLYRATLTLTEPGAETPCDRVQKIFGVPQRNIQKKHIGCHATDIGLGGTEEENRAALEWAKVAGISLILLPANGKEEAILSLCDTIGMGVFLVFSPDREPSALRICAQICHAEAQMHAHPSLLCLWMRMDAWEKDRIDAWKRIWSTWRKEREEVGAFAVWPKELSHDAFLTDVPDMLLLQNAIAAPDTEKAALRQRQQAARRSLLKTAYAAFHERKEAGYFILPPLSCLADMNRREFLQLLKKHRRQAMQAQEPSSASPSLHEELVYPDDVFLLGRIGPGEHTLFGLHFCIFDSPSPALICEETEEIFTDGGRSVADMACVAEDFVPILYNIKGELVAACRETNGSYLLIDLAESQAARQYVYRKFMNYRQEQERLFPGARERRMQSFQKLVNEQIPLLFRAEIDLAK